MPLLYLVCSQYKLFLNNLYLSSPYPTQTSCVKAPISSMVVDMSPSLPSAAAGGYDVMVQNLVLYWPSHGFLNPFF